ncbi:TPA: hypothetical protein ACH3X2_008418 [Trebouxia sp. C0005]
MGRRRREIRAEETEHPGDPTDARTEQQGKSRRLRSVKELTVNWQRGDTSWSDQLNGIRMTDAVDVNRVYDVLSSRISSRRGDAVSEAGWQDALRLLPKTDKVDA